MTALTWLYVPADRPERVEKALTAGADVVIVDLEDAVASDRKVYARDAVRDMLAEPVAVPVHVRINALGGPLFADDIAAVAGLAGVSGMRLPKVTSASEVRGVAALAPGLSLWPLVESALGVELAFDIAREAAVAGIALGEGDLSADLGMSTEDGLAWARGRGIVAARAAGLPPPVQAVYPHVRDLDGLRRSCAVGRKMSFLGRTAIHPAQLPVIREAYLPSAEEIARAQEEIVTAAKADGGAWRCPTGASSTPRWWRALGGSSRWLAWRSGEPNAPLVTLNVTNGALGSLLERRGSRGESDPLSRISPADALSLRRVEHVRDRGIGGPRRVRGWLSPARVGGSRPSGLRMSPLWTLGRADQRCVTSLSARCHGWPLLPLGTQGGHKSASRARLIECETGFEPCHTRRGGL